MDGIETKYAICSTGSSSKGRTPNSELRTRNPATALVGGLPTRFSAERQFLRIANRARLDTTSQFVSHESLYCRGRSADSQGYR